MPGRIIPLVTDHIYHVFNRGIDRRPTFTNKREFARAIETIKFYRFSHPPVKLSKFLTLSIERRNEILESLSGSEKLVEILGFVLMPNHFHFLLRQVSDKGISKFLGNLQNSYTKYFNTKNKRDGSLFLDQFKAVRIETDEQLIHVSRYIHLNPLTAYIIKTFEELKNYPWSSFSMYLQAMDDFIEIKTIMEFFKNTKQYEKFVFDNMDYQRELKLIEHLAFDLGQFP